MIMVAHGSTRLAPATCTSVANAYRKLGVHTGRSSP
jgi:hypothetical protein